jgi:endonuclease-3
MVHAHHWLILHGRYICQARRPLCERCGVIAYCDSAPRELLSGQPAAKSMTKSTATP